MILEYSKKAERDLRSLSRPVITRILDKMDWFAEQKDPLEFAELLQGTNSKLYRFRIGDYRAIFTLKGSEIRVLFVVTVQHRGEVYR